VQKLLDIKLVETIDDVLELALLDAPEEREQRRSGGIRVVTSPSAPPAPSAPPGQARR